MTIEPIAHTPPTPERDPHPLATHSHGVAVLAEAFSQRCGGDAIRAWARAAGLWHDLGKYDPEFQRYLRDCMAAQRVGQPPPAKRGITHSTAGAIHALRRWGPPGKLLAFAIAGHHAGLPDFPIAGADANAGAAALEARLRDTRHLDAALRGVPPAVVLDTNPFEPLPRGADLALFVRMVFSCLVDADRLDTEAYRTPGNAAQRARNRARHATMTELEQQLDAFLAAKQARADDTPVNRLRRELLVECGEAALLSPGLFSLTAPTGLGKTLSGLKFCLRHAAGHGKDRVICVAPYTSIIEQTAAVYRDALGPENVLEHHSAFDPDARAREAPAEVEDVDTDPADEEARVWRLAVENWDAPVIVTTAVQFFESLHAAQAGRCRKLHRVANSVVFLDEAQLIPTDFLAPILRTLTELLHRYGVTLVLSTATQPALDPRCSVSQDFKGISGPPKALNRPETTGGGNRTEIVSDVNRYHALTRRFTVELPDDLRAEQPLEAVATRIRDLPVVLRIVNTRAAACGLCRLMPEGTYHLSATMCPQHRFEVIEEIRARLRERREGRSDQPVRVVSTQLVEAGVDLDFPVVFRALAGLDSLAQSAGRCNRDGLLAAGRFVVVVLEGESLPASLRTPMEITRDLLEQRPSDPFAPAVFQRYFQDLFWSRGRALDAKGIVPLLSGGNPDKLEFRTASDRFGLIDDFRESVVVPWGDAGREIIHALRRGPISHGPDGWGRLLRRVQRYTVGVSTSDRRRMEAGGGVERAGEILLTRSNFYHGVYGVQPEG